MTQSEEKMQFWMRLLYSVAGFLDAMIAVAVTVNKILARALA